MGLYLTPVLKTSCWLWGEAGFAPDFPSPGRVRQIAPCLPIVSWNVPLPTSRPADAAPTRAEPRSLLFTLNKASSQAGSLGLQDAGHVGRLGHPLSLLPHPKYKPGERPCCSS